MRIGILCGIEPEDLERKVAALSLPTCQVISWEPTAWTDASAISLRGTAAALDISVTHFFVGWSGPRAFNPTEGPATVGLVPPEHRQRRTEEILHGCRWAANAGIPSVFTHVGFLPSPGEAEYDGVKQSLQAIAETCGALGLTFLLETGQETPLALRTMLEDIDSPALGVNFDPANLVLYGMGEPTEALETLGAWVWGVHVKNGNPPSEPGALGAAALLEEGMVDWPGMLRRLRELGYEGALTLERPMRDEADYDQARQDITRLRGWLTELDTQPKP